MSPPPSASGSLPAWNSCSRAGQGREGIAQALRRIHQAGLSANSPAIRDRSGCGSSAGRCRGGAPCRFHAQRPAWGGSLIQPRISPPLCLLVISCSSLNERLLRNEKLLESRTLMSEWPFLQGFAKTLYKDRYNSRPQIERETCREKVCKYE